ncbi:MAG: regulator [bacterium]|jgi:frataxin-like iron-binding protein CyaY
MRTSAAAVVILAFCGAAFGADAVKLPYVYTKWKHFTVKDGLPNDHIFAIKADGPRVWIGTENGLAMLDKRTGKIRSWTEKDGLPFQAVAGIDIDPKTGDVWLALFGGGLARFSGGRFDHWHQLNSGLVNDVVYGVAVQGDNVWAATTAGASRYNTRTGEWTIYNEKNAPMEEIWNYGISYNGGDKMFLAVWGSGVLEYTISTDRWKDYLDPDREMEIDLYRDDGILHVITTAAQEVEGALWVSSYFGASRYDGRNWRAFYNQDSGLPSDFINNLSARSSDEAWFCTDKGAAAIVDFATNTWVSYTRNPDGEGGKAVVMRDKQVLETVELPVSIPHNYIIAADVDGNDVWIGTAKGLGWGIGEGYYRGLRERPPMVTSIAQQQGGAK